MHARKWQFDLFYILPARTRILLIFPTKSIQLVNLNLPLSGFYIRPKLLASRKLGLWRSNAFWNSPSTLILIFFLLSELVVRGQKAYLKFDGSSLKKKGSVDWEKKKRER
jgi:hypothetical protein